MIQCAMTVPALGVRRDDLGKGMTQQKVSFMSGANLVAEGSVALNSLMGMSRRAWNRTRAWVRSSPLNAPARVVGRVTRPVRGWMAFR